MSKDWNELSDKGPPIEENIRWRKKAKKGYKRFAIETRYVGPPRKFLKWMFNREWHAGRRYYTARQRNQALAHLNHRRQNSHDLYRHWEFRPVEV